MVYILTPPFQSDPVISGLEDSNIIPVYIRTDVPNYEVVIDEKHFVPGIYVDSDGGIPYFTGKLPKVRRNEILPLVFTVYRNGGPYEGEEHPWHPWASRIIGVEIIKRATKLESSNPTSFTTVEKNYFSYQFKTDYPGENQKIVKTSGNLPKGITLSETGLLYGVPEGNELGEFTFTIGVIENNELISESPLITITVDDLSSINKPIWITDAGVLAYVYYKKPKEVSFLAYDYNGRTVNYEMVDSHRNNFPTGYKFTDNTKKTGILEGICETQEKLNWEFCVRPYLVDDNGVPFKDENGETIYGDERIFYIKTNFVEENEEIKWITEEVGPVKIGYTYDFNIEAESSREITYKIIEGKLPSGLTMNSYGEVSGTVDFQDLGFYSFVVRAKTIATYSDKEFIIEVKEGLSKNAVETYLYINKENQEEFQDMTSKYDESSAYKITNEEYKIPSEPKIDIATLNCWDDILLRYKFEKFNHPIEVFWKETKKKSFENCDFFYKDFKEGNEIPEENYLMKHTVNETIYNNDDGSKEKRGYIRQPIDEDDVKIKYYYTDPKSGEVFRIPEKNEKYIEKRIINDEIKYFYNNPDDGKTYLINDPVYVPQKETYDYVDYGKLYIEPGNQSANYNYTFETIDEINDKLTYEMNVSGIINDIKEINDENPIIVEQTETHMIDRNLTLYVKSNNLEIDSNAIQVKEGGSLYFNCNGNIIVSDSSFVVKGGKLTIDGKYIDESKDYDYQFNNINEINDKTSNKVNVSGIILGLTEINDESPLIVKKKPTKGIERSLDLYIRTRDLDIETNGIQINKGGSLSLLTNGDMVLSTSSFVVKGGKLTIDSVNTDKYVVQVKKGRYYEIESKRIVGINETIYIREGNDSNLIKYILKDEVIKNQETDETLIIPNNIEVYVDVLTEDAYASYNPYNENSSQYLLDKKDYQTVYKERNKNNYYLYRTIKFDNNEEYLEWKEQYDNMENKLNPCVKSVYPSIQGIRDIFSQSFNVSKYDGKLWYKLGSQEFVYKKNGELQDFDRQRYTLKNEGNGIYSASFNGNIECLFVYTKLNDNTYRQVYTYLGLDDKGEPKYEPLIQKASVLDGNVDFIGYTIYRKGSIKPFINALFECEWDSDLKLTCEYDEENDIYQWFRIAEAENPFVYYANLNEDYGYSRDIILPHIDEENVDITNSNEIIYGTVTFLNLEEEHNLLPYYMETEVDGVITKKYVPTLPLFYSLPHTNDATLKRINEYEKDGNYWYGRKFVFYEVHFSPKFKKNIDNFTIDFYNNINDNSPEFLLI